MSRAIAAVFCAVFISSCAAPGGLRRGGGGKSPDIRVLIDKGAGPFSLSASGGFVVRTTFGQPLLNGSSAVSISGEYPAVYLGLEPEGTVATADGGVEITPVGNSVFSYGGSSYAGTMKAVFDADRRLLLINVVPLETYLEGVLPHEIGNPGPDAYDALKVQAIAARTYAVDKIEARMSEPFDVYSDVLDQVYNGLDRRTRLTNSAVRETAGRVLESGGRTVKAYYSSCCGGHTSDIAFVWPDREGAEYLRGVPDSDERSRGAFCGQSRYFRWRYSFSGKQIGDILRSTLPQTLGVSARDVGSFRDIRVNGVSPSGRVVSVTIETTKNKFTIVGDQIRWVLVTDLRTRRILPSTMFHVEKFMEGDQVAFVSIVGGGNGHGVGLCQNGALAMARQGYTYKMILSHYYPRCAVIRKY